MIVEGGGIDDEVGEIGRGGAGSGVGGQRIIEGAVERHAAVGGEVHALVRGHDEAPGGVGVKGDAANVDAAVARVVLAGERSRAERRPRAAAVGALEDARAIEGVAVEVFLAGPHVDRPWIVGAEGDTAHGERRLVVGQRGPVAAAVGRLPHSAILGPGIEGMIGPIVGEGRHTARGVAVVAATAVGRGGATRVAVRRGGRGADRGPPRRVRGHGGDAGAGGQGRPYIGAGDGGREGGKPRPLRIGPQVGAVGYVAIRLGALPVVPGLAVEHVVARIALSGGEARIGVGRDLRMRDGGRHGRAMTPAGDQAEGRANGHRDSHGRFPQAC